MQAYEIQLIQSISLLLVGTLVLKIIQRLISLAGRRFSYAKHRIKVINKVISFIYTIIGVVIIGLIWGIAPSQLAAYIGSLLAVIGIAFLAQWSLLSNITAAMIIFFNHQVNIGDTVEILDKDYNICGKVSNIGVFFIIIKVNNEEYVSIPSNIFMQKMVKKLKKSNRMR